MDADSTMDMAEYGAAGAAQGEAGEGCGKLCAAIHRALAGTHVLMFKTYAALDGGAFQDGDEDDGCAAVARASLADAKMELRAGAAALMALGDGPCGSISAMVQMSPVPDSEVPEDDIDVIDMMCDGHDAVGSAWGAAAELAGDCGRGDVAQFAAQRAQAHFDMAKACDEFLDDEDDDSGDDDGDPDMSPGWQSDDGSMGEGAGEAPSPLAAFLGEAAVKTAKPMQTKTKKPVRKDGRKMGRKKAGETTVPTSHEMRIGDRTPEEIHAQATSLMRGKAEGRPVAVAQHLMKAGEAIRRTKTLPSERKRNRHIANLTASELRAKMDLMAKRG